MKSSTFLPYSHSLRPLYAAGLLTILATASSAALADNNHSSTVCSKTANLALRACYKESSDDLLLAKGNCINLKDYAAREECLGDLREEKQQVHKECREQYQGRRNLCRLLKEDRYDPSDFWQADNFVDPADIGIGVAPNPYFPLLAGTRILTNEDEIITITVTTKTKLIEGVSCVVVNDVGEEAGVAKEDTDDWYAQDVDGNVWYCGEISKNFEFFAGDDPFEAELVDIEGSWKAFRDGAKPGIVAKAFPEVGDVYRQELLLGDAEDAAIVISIDADGLLEGDVCDEDGEAIAEFVDNACDSNCLVTYDFTPLEADAREHKYYQPGEGVILEVDLEGGGCTVLAQDDE